MKFRTPQNVRVNSDNKFRKMIFLSLIFHFVVISVVFVSIPSSPRRITFGPVYSVQLVGAEIALHQNSPSLSDYIQNTETPISSVIKRDTSEISTTPIKKEETNKSKIEKAIEAIKQKEAAPREIKNDSNAVGSNASGLAGTSTISGPASSYTNEYIALIQSKVKKNWTLPAALMPKNNVETIIEIKISREGNLEYIGFEKSSGNKYFDDSALNAVKKSAPFSPFPDYVYGKNIDIGIRFHSRELR